MAATLASSVKSGSPCVRSRTHLPASVISSVIFKTAISFPLIVVAQSQSAVTSKLQSWSRRWFRQSPQLLARLVRGRICWPCRSCLWPEPRACVEVRGLGCVGACGPLPVDRLELAPDSAHRFTVFFAIVRDFLVFAVGPSLGNH